MYLFSNTIYNNNLKNQIGGKASTLINLYNNGFNVPNGFAITVDDVKNSLSQSVISKIQKEIASLNENTATIVSSKIKDLILKEEFSFDFIQKVETMYSKLQVKEVAVRSSALNEDLSDMSFAGMYESFLNCLNIDMVILAIKKCLISCFEYRNLKYILDNGLDSNLFDLAIIVQEMVKSDTSGVGFSIDPIGGNDKTIIIEANFHLCESVVSGETSPDRYTYNWFDESLLDYKISTKEKTNICLASGGTKMIDTPAELQTKPVLTKEVVADVANIILKLQVYFGFPIDCEWAIYNGEIYVLQCRPITKILYTSMKDKWTTANFRDGGVSSLACKPLMASLYDIAFTDSFRESLKEIKLMDKTDNRKIYDVFFARPYWNIGIGKECLSKVLGFNERDHDEDLGIQITYDGDGLVSKLSFKNIFQSLTTLYYTKKRISLEMKTYEETLLNLKEKTKISGKKTFDNCSTSELYSEFKSVVGNEYLQAEIKYFSFILTNLFVQSFFKNDVKKYVNKIDSHLFMNGIESISHMQVVKSAFDLSEKIKEMNFTDFWTKPVSEIVAIYQSGENDFCLSDVRELIGTYGYHSTLELDISYPCYDERPDDIIFIIKKSLSLSADLNPYILEKKQTEIFSTYKSNFLKTVKNKHKIENSIDIMRTNLWLKEEYKDISTRYYNIIRKITIKLAENLTTNNILDDVDDIFFLKYSEIESFLNSNDIDAFRKCLNRNKLYYKSFVNFSNQDEIGVGFQEKLKVNKNTRILKGVACSGEKITGTARVIKDIFDADRLQHGDILVTKSTNQAWTTKFSGIGGLVTETGGLLSHSAIVSREYGICSILVVENATSIIKDGDTITLDCLTGNVILL